MAKSTRMKSEDRKQSILEAALPMFAEKGFAATTTREIAIAAGVSEALLYKHYPSKDSIYKDLQSFCCSESQASADKISKLEPSTSTLIAAMYLVSSSIVLGVPGDPKLKPFVTSLCAHSLAETSEFATSMISSHLEPWVYKFHECYEAAVESGDVDPWIPDTRRCVLFTHHLAAMISIFTNREEQYLDYKAKPEQLVEEITHFCLRGMGVKEEAIKKYYNPNALAMFI